MRDTENVMGAELLMHKTRDMVHRLGSYGVRTVLALTLGLSPVAHGASPEDTDSVVRSLGLKESETAARDMSGWRPPTRIVVRADAERIAWLADAAPGVELVAAASHAEAVNLVADADGIMGYCSEDVLAAGEKLHWIQLPYAGAERCLAIDAIRARNVLVTNAQRIYGPEIAEHVIAMMLAFTRGLHISMAAQRRAEWDRDAYEYESQLWELSDKTMLVVGLGGIGTEVARRASALGMDVIATRNSSRSGPDFVSYVGLSDELLTLAAKADVVVNALPLTPATKGLFDTAFFDTMKSRAYFINVGRGQSVVTDDLLIALDDGAIAGAGLDVTDPEPLPSDHPLWKHPNVIITPHVAAGSDLRRQRLWTVMKENLRRYAAGERIFSVVSVERGY